MLSHLDADFLLWSLWFSSGLLYRRFFVDEAALQQVFILVCSVFYLLVILPPLSLTFCHRAVVLNRLQRPSPLTPPQSTKESTRGWKCDGRTESQEQLFFLHANWEQQTKESAVVDGTSCCVILECLVTSIACIT